jgi:hypothetical protein
VEHHQLGQAHPVDQNETRWHALRVIPGISGESACGDENTAVRLRPMQGPTNAWISGRPTE